MKVVVFGGAGDVGSNISKYLLDNVPDVYVSAIDNLSTGSMDRLRYLHANPCFDFFLGSIEDIFFVELTIADANIIINCTDTYDADRLLSTVIVGTQNILDCLCPEQKYIHFNFTTSIIDVDLHNACHMSSKLLVEAHNFKNRALHPINAYRIFLDSEERYYNKVTTILNNSI
jgi:dTDP-glucose 4,6-dehydratase